MTLSAVGGFQSGPEVTEQSRYAYILLVLLAPTMAICLIGLRRASVALPQPIASVMAVTVLAGFLLHAIDLERSEATEHVKWSNGLRDRVLGSVAALKDGERVLTARPDGLDSTMNISLLTGPRMVNTLPSDKVSPGERLEAEAEFFVGVGEKTFGLFAPTSPTSTSFEEMMLPGRGCTGYTSNSSEPEISLTTERGVEIAVDSDSTELTTLLERGDDVSASRIWQVSADQPIHIATTAKDARLVIGFNKGGEFIVCKR